MYVHVYVYVYVYVYVHVYVYEYEYEYVDPQRPPLKDAPPPGAVSVPCFGAWVEKAPGAFHIAGWKERVDLRAVGPRGGAKLVWNGPGPGVLAGC